MHFCYLLKEKFYKTFIIFSIYIDVCVIFFPLSSASISSFPVCVSSQLNCFLLTEMYFFFHALI